MATPGDKPLSQSEVDALIGAISAGEVEVSAQEPEIGRPTTLYDFKRPERVGRDEIRAIETLYEVFARNLQASLTASLRTLLDIKVSNVDQLTYSEFVNSLPNPTCFNVLSCEPLEGSFILEINPVIAFPIIERLLGSGKIASAQPERPITEIEWKLLQAIIDKCLQLLRELWANIQSINFKVSAKESNPQLVPLMSPNEPVIAISLEVIIGEHRGFINLCVPVISLEGVIGKISEQSWFAYKRKEAGSAYQDAITKSLGKAEVNVVVHLADAEITVRELLKLAPGDVITTAYHQNRPAVLLVEGKPKFYVKPGFFKNKRAVRVHSLIPHGELS